MSSLGGVRAPPVARKGMRMCCVDAATVLALVVLCASLAALLLGMLARFPAGDFAPVRIKYRWNDESCTTEMSFMCRDKRGEFIFHEAKLDWFGAREACTAQDMTLASLHSEDEAEKLRAVHQPAGEHVDIWIGLNDRRKECGKDGSCFTWQDGSELAWMAWADGEPNDWSQSEDQRNHGPGPTRPDDRGNPGCTANTKHLGDDESPEARAAVASRVETNTWRRLALSMLAIGSLGCGLAALVVCIVSVISGQALLRSGGTNRSARGASPAY